MNKWRSRGISSQSSTGMRNRAPRLRRTPRLWTSTRSLAQRGDLKSVIGLHFFSPAHVMKLLEVVRGARTDRCTIRRATALGRRLGKVPVPVCVCDGFVDNRLTIARERQAGAPLIEGALPDQVDRVLREFGLPMGTFELQDLAAGIELDYRHRQSTGAKDYLVDRLFEMGRTRSKDQKRLLFLQFNGSKASTG